MSQQIPENFVNSYANNFYETGQQTVARFRPAVEVVTGIIGQSKTVERAGKIDPQIITTRHGDTKYGEIPHSRRWIDLQDYGIAELVDELDQQKLLADPKSIYPRLLVQGMNRTQDDVIYAAGRGSARTNTGTTALAAAQKIAEGGTGLTLAKLLTAKEILDAAEIAQVTAESSMAMTGQAVIYDRTIAVSSKQLTNLYGTTEIKNIDYNTVKALAEGQISTFLGFKFIRSERLAKTGTTRFALAWVRQAIRLGIGKDVMTSIDIMPNKNYAWQVYARMSLGAVRVEDEGVIEIGCFE